jgi:hypothetical protein
MSPGPTPAWRTSPTRSRRTSSAASVRGVHPARAADSRGWPHALAPAHRASRARSGQSSGRADSARTRPPRPLTPTIASCDVGGARGCGATIRGACREPTGRANPLFEVGPGSRLAPLPASPPGWAESQPSVTSRHRSGRAEGGCARYASPASGPAARRPPRATPWGRARSARGADTASVGETREPRMPACPSTGQKLAGPTLARTIGTRGGARMLALLSQCEPGKCPSARA